MEGYGMTETSCIISAMDEGDNLTGHVGSPNASCGELWNYTRLTSCLLFLLVLCTEMLFLCLIRLS